MSKVKRILNNTTDNKEYKLTRMSDWLHEWCEPFFNPQGMCRLCKKCKRVKPRNWKNYRRYQWRNVQSSN